MDKISIPKNIFTKKTRDYTFAVLFLLIFSMFIIFAIGPSLTTAASLKKEEQDLSHVDSIYESKIVDISSIQSQVEENRDDLFLFDEAVTKYPQVNKMVEDIKLTADKNKVIIQKANIDDVNLLQNKKQISSVKFTVEAKAAFPDLMNFFNDIASQRRLKLLDKVMITRDNESTSSAILKVNMNISGYYL